MHIGVKQELDKTSALELPSFEPEEIDFWLNNAIRKFVKTRYSGNNPKGQSFEETQKRIDDLRPLLSKYFAVNDQGTMGILADGSLVYPNSYYIMLPIEDSTYGGEDYWITIQEEVTISYSSSSYNAGIVECTHDEYRQKIEDPFSEHIIHYGKAKPLRLYLGDYVYLITDGTYVLEDYILTYLRKPAEVQVTATAVDCDLPEHTHDEIVKLTVDMMLENIEQPRYRTHTVEVATME